MANCAPDSIPRHLSTRLVYLAMGLAQELEPLSGPELNPKYVLTPTMLRWAQSELIWDGLPLISSIPPGHKGIHTVLGMFS